MNAPWRQDKEKFDKTVKSLQRGLVFHRGLCFKLGFI